jgi:uncharacterized C2H2 Zn-finger protein
MSFFQKIGNALARFMYGRNGVDRLGLTMLWTAILMDLICYLFQNALVRQIIGAVSFLLTILVLFRMFSRNLDKRRGENAKFMEKIRNPIRGLFRGAKVKSQDKEHKYFTCPNCRAVCRVPKGKGKIVITCPRCGGEIHGKS